MKHIVFITACVLLFLAATSAENEDDEETEDDKAFNRLLTDKSFNISAYKDPISKKNIRTKAPRGHDRVADDSGLRGSAVGLGTGGMGGGALASGGLENLLWNYLMAKQMARQMQREQVDQPAAVPDFQRKRSGWKQCSFNAVSCFGRRK